MEKRRVENGICYLAGAVYILFTGSLMVMSVFMHCQTNIFDYGHTKALETHRPFPFCAVAAIGILAVAICYMLVKWFLDVPKCTDA